jgi:hypothetical protein
VVAGAVVGCFTHFSGVGVAGVTVMLRVCNHTAISMTWLRRIPLTTIRACNLGP